MTVTVMRQGTKGDQVRRLQEALNRKLTGTRVTVDGDFGSKTKAAVRKFQEEGWLVVDGEAGQCTQNALFDAEAYAPIRHQRPFIPQPTEKTCWAASIAMLKRSTVNVVIAATPTDLISSSGGILNVSNKVNWEPETTRFAGAHGLRTFAPASWSPQGFAGMLRHGPIVVDTLWSVTGYLKRIPIGYQGSASHLTLVVGCRGDNDPTGRGTSLLVYDPWEPNVGKRWRVSYHGWMTEVSTRTYRMFQ